MSKQIISVLLVLASLSAFGAGAEISPSSEFVYFDFHFFNSSNANAIGSIGGKQNIVFFRYGKVKGKRYLGFTDMTDDHAVNYQCSPQDFYAKLTGTGKNKNCNKEALDVYKEDVVGSLRTRRWASDKMTEK